MKKVLVTGFGAFGHTKINPAKLVVDALDTVDIDGAELATRVVPCVFFESIDFVVDAIDDLGPDVVVMLGEYGGRSMVTVERIAENLNDSSRYGLADNQGRVEVNEPTVPGGPAAYYTTLPIRAMVLAMRKAGIPADISDTPGTNLCNHLMYGVLHHVSERERPVPTGWVHLPHLPVTAALDENLGAPSMCLETSLQGIVTGIEAILAHDHDISDPLRSRWQI